VRGLHPLTAQPVGGGPQADRLDVAVRRADRHRHPAAPQQRGSGREHLAQPLDHRVGVGRTVGPRQVEVDDQVRRVGDLGDLGGQGAQGRGQVVHLDHEADQAQVRAGELVVAGHAGSPVEPGRAEVLQVAPAVVAAGEHLEEGLGLGAGGPEALGQQADQRFGARHEGLDALGLPVRLVAELGEQPLGLVDDLLAGLAHHRLLEEAEADGPRQVADRRVAQLGGDDEAVQHLRHLVARWTGRRLGGGQPAVEQREHGRQLVRDALLRQEDAVHRLLQLGPGVEAAHAVVQQGAAETSPEGVGQPLALEVERVQVGVEVLAGAVHLLVAGVLAGRRAVARELAEVGEGGQRGELGVQQLGVVDR